MWNVPRILHFAITTTSFLTHALSQSTLPYFAPVPSTTTNTSLPFRVRLDFLFKRDGNCPSGYGSCSYMGAPQFCCAGNANCAIDPLGHAGCCPRGAVCTGTIGGTGFVTAGGTATGTTTTTTAGAGAGAGAGFVGGATGTGVNPATLATNSFSIVPNQYYPFKAIPTTYTNAAACSAAWTGCQTDMTRCTNYLGGSTLAGGTGVLTGNAGVTISAPNIGGTAVVQQSVASPTVTLPAVAASSICSSLSLQACSGLQVTACSVFGLGNGALGKGCGQAYTAAVGGAAVGIAGQMLWG